MLEAGTDWRTDRNIKIINSSGDSDEGEEGVGEEGWGIVSEDEEGVFKISREVMVSELGEFHERSQTAR